MAGAKDKADARILTERIEHWPSMTGWWRTSPEQSLVCGGCASADPAGHIPYGALVFVPGEPAGACFCEKHAEQREAVWDLAPEGQKLLEKLEATEIQGWSLSVREVVARERLAAAAEQFAKSFDSLVNPVVRYIKHITRQQ